MNPLSRTDVHRVDRCLLSVTLLALLFTLTACTIQQTPPLPHSMQSSSSSSQSPAAASLVGRWEVAFTEASNGSITFAQDGTYQTVVGGREFQRGKWSVDGDSLHLQPTDALENPQNEYTLTWHGAGMLQITAKGQGYTQVWRRLP